MFKKKTLNHECRNCGKKYYACNDCERVNSWKKICCSVKCYDEYTEKIIRSRMKKQEVEVAPVVETEVSEPEVTEVEVEKSAVKEEPKVIVKRTKEK